jgi:DNA-binding NarL/FixJ family response regulator
MISLTLVDDHKLFGECLALVLDGFEQLKVLDFVSNEEVPVKLKSRQPDIVLININLYNNTAIKLTKQLAHDFPRLKIIIFGLTEVEFDIFNCVEAGANGYVLKEASLDDLRMAIKLVACGETVCSPKIAYYMFSRLSELARQYRGTAAIESMPLTSREIEILQLIADGWSNKQIASHLSLSLFTVKNHVHNILGKLKVQHRSEAVEQAYERRWIKNVRSVYRSLQLYGKVKESIV